MRDLLRLRKLEKQLAAISREHRAFKETEEYKKADAESKEKMTADFPFEYFEIYEEIRDIKTQKLLRKVRKYEIPVPSRTDKRGQDYWEAGQYGTYYLTEEGYHRIRKDVREEKKSRRDDFFLWWLPLFSLIGMLLSIMVALLTIIRYGNK